MIQSKNHRNFGWGKNIEFAGKHALMFAADESGGRFGWLAANKFRWSKFCRYVSPLGITDARQVNAAVIEGYAASISGLSVAVQHNYISAINVTLRHLSGGSWNPVSPREIVGLSRYTVRTTPILFTEGCVKNASKDLRNSGHVRLSYIPLLCYFLGLRRREAALLYIEMALQEARICGTVDVRRGTKGGRGISVERLVPTSAVIEGVLADIAGVIDSRDECLIPKGSSYKRFNSDISNTVLPALKRHGINKLQDLRVAYACQRYSDITGNDAPCNQMSKTRVPAVIDEPARQTISNELGHGRGQIVSAYIGVNPPHRGGDSG